MNILKTNSIKNGKSCYILFNKKLPTKRGSTYIKLLPLQMYYEIMKTIKI